MKRCGFFLRCLMFLYQSSHGIVIYSVLLPYYFADSPFIMWLGRWAVIVGIPMILYTHCVTSSTKSISFSRQRNPNFMNNKEKIRYLTCDKCSAETKWKPTRTKHCKVQQADVTKFDHFCPVTMNTIGYRNHSAFLKTAYLHLFWSAVWLLLYFSYFWAEVASAKQYSSPLAFGLCMIFNALDNLFMLMVCCMSIGVSLGHSFYATINTTTIEQISSMTSGNRTNPLHKRFGSYNFGFLYNLRQFFPSPMWLFWWPMPKDCKYEGYYFPQLGVPKELFALKVLEMQGQQLGDRQVELKEEDMIDACKYLYPDTVFKFGDKTYTI